MQVPKKTTLLEFLRSTMHSITQHIIDHPLYMASSFQTLKYEQLEVVVEYQRLVI